jgi:hypothetical protein
VVSLQSFFVHATLSAVCLPFLESEWPRRRSLRCSADKVVVTLLLLAAMAVPQMAFWLELGLQGQRWYMRNPGLLGTVVSALAPSWFLIPFLFICHLLVLTAGWPRLTVRGRVIAVLLALSPVPALMLPVLLALSF